MSEPQGYSIRASFEGLETGDERIMPGAFKVDGKEVPVFNWDHSKVVGTGRMKEDGIFEFEITDERVLDLIKADPRKGISRVEMDASIAVTKDGEVVEAVAYPQQAEPTE